MALIGMAVWDTEENQRTALTERTLASLFQTVDFSRHRLVISDNGSCQATQDLYERLPWRTTGRLVVLKNRENIGTARAINRAWKLRGMDDNCIKMDNDVEIQQAGWIDIMEDAIRREPKLGIVGLMRKDLDERPRHPLYGTRGFQPPYEWYRATGLEYLAQQKGERCIIVMDCKHIMGTCQMYSSALLDRLGGLVQPGVYGFDDALASIRAHLAGFRTVFIPYIEIDHIDPGTTPFQAWKEQQAHDHMEEYSKLTNEYLTGKRSLWENPC